ncbi:MAG: RidA family protein [Alphaproteobacteria bacterium]
MTDPQRLDPGPRMSKAVRHGDTIYTMGHVAGDRSGDISAQTADVLSRLDATLAEMGSDKSKLLSVTIYLADMEEFPGMNAVWDAWVDGPSAPARTTVGAPLAAPEIRVEMTAIAAA